VETLKSEQSESANFAEKGWLEVVSVRMRVRMCAVCANAFISGLHESTLMLKRGFLTWIRAEIAGKEYICA
jgi:hypothetical protein